MNRAIGMIIISVLLISLGVWQEIYIHDVINVLNTSTKQLEVVVDQYEDNINCDPVKKEFQKLQTFWSKKEPKLCYIVNFEKIKYINESLVKLEGAITQNDFSVALENVKTLQNYSSALHYIMGMNINNIL